MKSLLLISFVVLLSACGAVQKAQYSALEKVGIHKRDILVERIEKAAKTQEQTKKQFQSAYQQLAALVDAQDKQLENKYKKLALAVDQSENKAEQLDEHIKSVNSVATALFKEWQQELDEYTSASLRKASEQNLQQTKQRYRQLYQKMQASQQRVTPVLEILQDNTLYLKHNLNARTVSGLSNQVLVVEDKVAKLIQQMEASISESKQFIDSINKNK